MKKILFVTLGLAVAAAFLTGCGFTAGNHRRSIEYAVSKCEERYGVELKVKRKALFPGGAGCDVYCTCKELPGKEIRVYGMDERPSHMLVCCDYIYQKYSDDLLRLTTDAVHEVCPDHIVNMYENTYNHFPPRDYDKNTTFADYISDNVMVLYDIVPEPMSKDEMLTCYYKVKSALDEKGIKVRICIYSVRDSAAADRVKRYTYIEDYTVFEFLPENDIACCVSDGDGSPVYREFGE
ncbi:MAG: hypothetical protein J6I96_04575 [Oscillospiraceae bacterium]|nr:hypothetical protein [Oscillospiraceae bacterium]